MEKKALFEVANHSLVPTAGLGSSTVLVLKYIFISAWCMEMSKYLYLYLTKKYLVLGK